MGFVVVETGSNFIYHVGLKFIILLPYPPESCDYKFSHSKGFIDLIFLIVTMIVPSPLQIRCLM